MVSEAGQSARFKKALSVLAFLGVAALVIVGIMRGSEPEPEETLQQGIELEKAGEAEEAARIFYSLYESPVESEARERNAKIFENLEEYPGYDAAYVLAMARRMGEVDPTEAGRAAVAYLESRAHTPNEVDAVVRSVRTLVPQHKALDALWNQSLSSSESADHRRLLAEALETQGNLERAAEVLDEIDDQKSKVAKRIRARLHAERSSLPPSELFATYRDYLEENRDEYEKAVQTYTGAVNQRMTELNERLANEDFPPTVSSKLERASEESKNGIKVEWYNRELWRDPRVVEAEWRIERHRAYEEMALEFSKVALRLAEAEPARRSKALGAAMSVLESLREERSSSGASAGVELARMHYWLGEDELAEKAVEEALEARPRDVWNLIEIAGMQRKVGLEARPRELARRAYELATESGDEPAAEQAAGMLAMLAESNEEAVEWYEKTSLRSDRRRASLAKARGMVALDRGDRKAAVQHFDEALKYHSEQEESPVALNNLALVYLVRSRASGDPTDRERGLILIKRAAAMAPGEAIAQLNAGEAILDVATMEAFGRSDGALDVEIDDLGFAVDSHAEKMKKLRAVSGLIDEAVEYLEKARALSPKDYNVYTWLLDIHAAREEPDAIRELQRLARQADVAESDLKSEHERYLSGEMDQMILDSTQTDLARLRKTLEKIDPEEDPQRWAFVACQLAGEHTSLTFLGPRDPAVYAGLVRKALESHPSLGTRSCLQSVLIEEAISSLENHESFAKWYSSRRRIIGSYSAIIQASGDPRFARLTREDEAVQALVEYVSGLIAESPSLITIGDWKLLSNAEHSAARDAARILKTNRSKRERVRFGAQTLKYYPSFLMREAWYRELEGDDAGARETRERAVEAGWGKRP